MVHVERVQAQLEAYNKKDLEAFCAQYHPEVEVFQKIQDGSQFKLVSQGMESFRKMYEHRFATAPDLHCEIVSRIVLGEHVLDEESVLSEKGKPRSHVVAIYGFKDGLIHHIYFVR